MLFLSYLRRLYSLDTLDTRFTVSSKAPVALVKDEAFIDAAQARNGVTQNAVQASDRARDDVHPSKWNTLEFYVYYLVFLLAIPNMFRVVYEVSKESHPNYPKFAPLVEDGWIFGRKVDNSDAQYASFRDNIVYMCILLVLHPLLRRAYDYVFPSRASTYESVQQSDGHRAAFNNAPARAKARLEQRASYDLYFALAFLVALHGISAIKILTILYANYNLAKRTPKAWVPTVTWLFNIGVLFANELLRGYPLSGFAELILPSRSPDMVSPSQNWGAYLDTFGGLVPRWEILFKITVLRMISFNLDYYWSLDTGGSSPLEKKQLDPTNLSERDRVALPASPRLYNFRNYLSYTLYSPLYLAGPILTFNDYVHQLHYPPPSIAKSRTTLYAVRFVICLLTMEVCLHYFYAVAISKASPDWSTYTPFQLSMLAYFNLHIIWLKLLLPWRFFRLWALIDGIDPPENMVRCMSDNYSALAFWRGWHRSFNRWVVRYIYIPLGGSGMGTSKVRAAANFATVFTFVALWHDINLKLLAWGWLVTLFVLPEVMATIAFPEREWKDSPTAYRLLCGIGGVGNVITMMAANLVGFALGLDGLVGLVSGIVGSLSGWLFLLTACAAVFTGVQVMFELREGEKRKGIELKC